MIYEYQCPSCGARVEVNRPVARRNDPLYCQCPKYPPKRMERVFSGQQPRIHFRDRDMTQYVVDVDRERVRLRESGQLVEPSEHTKKVARGEGIFK